MSELLSCPFCGCSAKIAQCDDEGNVRGEEYESNPWSGLGYRIVHESDDCPISTGEDGYNLIYDSREEAENHWNRRAERTCHAVLMIVTGTSGYAQNVGSRSTEPITIASVVERRWLGNTKRIIGYKTWALLETMLEFHNLKKWGMLCTLQKILRNTL